MGNLNWGLQPPIFTTQIGRTVQCFCSQDGINLNSSLFLILLFFLCLGMALKTNLCKYWKGNCFSGCDSKKLSIGRKIFSEGSDFALRSVTFWTRGAAIKIQEIHLSLSFKTNKKNSYGHYISQKNGAVIFCLQREAENISSSAFSLIRLRF